MKTRIYFLAAILFALSFAFSSCKKEKVTVADPTPTAPTQVYHSTNNGLGLHGGYPTGTTYTLPSNVKIIGSIHGGMPYSKASYIDKQTYQGPFANNNDLKANWISYGTGTYVNLYIAFYNTLATNATLTLPGGLIFVDSTDVNDSIGRFQKGFILQDVHIALPALDTAFAIVRAYCLNLHLMPSDYSSIYYIGPITNNVELNQIVTIMAPKQYPFGNEGSIQQIIWNVTDNALTLTPTEISYLNSLP
jgi:hypothetical protein